MFRSKYAAFLKRVFGGLWELLETSSEGDDLLAIMFQPYSTADISCSVTFMALGPYITRVHSPEEQGMGRVGRGS